MKTRVNERLANARDPGMAPLGRSRRIESLEKARVYRAGAVALVGAGSFVLRSNPRNAPKPPANFASIYVCRINGKIEEQILDGDPTLGFAIFRCFVSRLVHLVDDNAFRRHSRVGT